MASPDRAAHEAAPTVSQSIELAPPDRAQDQTSPALTFSARGLRAIAVAVEDELQRRRLGAGAPPTPLNLPNQSAAVQQAPRVDPVTDLDDDAWIRKCVDETMVWAKRAKVLDQAMGEASTPKERAEALAALDAHEPGYKALRRRHDDEGDRRSKLKLDREIAAEGFDCWLARVTAERDARRTEEKRMTMTATKNPAVQVGEELSVATKAAAVGRPASRHTVVLRSRD
jgi:hypothetical protein